MPHLYIEYTNNLEADIDVDELMHVSHETLLTHDDVIPIGGLRTRAVKLDSYRIADGAEDDAFVHLCLKIGAGRSPEVKDALCQTLFDAVTAYFEDTFNKRYLALSLELNEFTHKTYKKNNIHKRFK